DEELERWLSGDEAPPEPGAPHRPAPSTQRQVLDLFARLGLGYRFDAPEVPERMRTFWVALVWLGQREQRALTERMVCFGAALFDALLGSRRRRPEPGEERVVNRLLALLAREGGFLGEHSLRVMTLADALCEEMQVSDPELREQVRLGSLLRDVGVRGLEEPSLPPDLGSQVERLRASQDLHMAGRMADLGALRIPASIRNKPGFVTPEERAIIQRHPEHGEQLLFRFPPFRHLCPVVRAHHERWDGRGYPDGLMGRRIPLAARMIALCDVWDALTSDRPWRPALRFEQAFATVKAGLGTQFDPEVGRAFLRTVRRLHAEGYL
ncbi:MAG: HD domain-containing phosphohydrolase, partial [Candidatus Eremiobacterota bacterium]